MLVEVFSKHQISILEDDISILMKKFRVRDFEILLKIEGYIDYYARLKILKDDIEYIMETYELEWEQVLECLQLLRNKHDRHYEDIILTEELIKNSIYLSWSKDVQEIFDEGCSMIIEWKDFFLSYTNRNSIDTNDDFKDIIIGGLGETFYREAKEQVNCLARLILIYLKQNRLTYFFDKNTMKCGDELEEKILDYCHSSFTFIQLIEHAVFDDDSGKTNWCYKEYNSFEESIKKRQLDFCKRLFFFLTNERAFPVDEGMYNHWIVSIKKHIHVGNINELDKKRLRNRIDDLAKEIFAIRAEILDYYFEQIEKRIY